MLSGRLSVLVFVLFYVIGDSDCVCHGHGAGGDHLVLGRNFLQYVVSADFSRGEQLYLYCGSHVYSGRGADGQGRNY